jgi:hypothetical protein
MRYLDMAGNVVPRLQLNSIRKDRLFEREKNRKCIPAPKVVPSESDPQEFSNEWSYQYVSTILYFWGNFCVLPLLKEVNMSVLRREVSQNSVMIQLSILIS